MKLLTSIVFFFVIINLPTYAQETLTGLNKNPALSAAAYKAFTNISRTQKGSTPEIHLPMIDDFSTPNLFPQKKYWASNTTFINKSYAVNPPSIGVITFDAMDATGQVYGNMGIFAAIADTLLSQKIRLDSLFGNNAQKLSPSDSVYLSFFVQPQGNGAAPLEADSLVLQLYDSKNDQWNSVWHLKGMSLDTFRAHYDTSFIQVMIAVKDSSYFTKDFRFRFYNYAQIPPADKPSWRSGLYCNWNIDYLILDAHRNRQDTSYNDMAIQTYQTSLLVDYQSMPWNQFQAAGSNIMKPGLGVRFKNMDNITGPKNVNQYFYIYDLWDKTTAFEPTPNPSSTNIASQANILFKPNYSGYVFHSNAPSNPAFRVLYSIYTRTPPPDIISTNDTVAFFQRFYNYFSYDDGIPEAGYGLSTPTALLAYQFHVDTPDSLQSIEMYFNQTLGNANQQYFFLTVWDDNNGKPGNIIYEKSGKRPQFKNELFKYYTYVLDHAIKVSGTFYIGWRQTTKDNLNIGFDFNNDQSSKIFYNVTGSWVNTAYHGSLMIRPIMGQDDYAYVGIKKINNKKFYSLKVFPNPSNGDITIEASTIEDINSSMISIYDLRGCKVYQQKYRHNINLNKLAAGIYILQLYNKNRNINLQQKLIISR